MESFHYTRGFIQHSTSVKRKLSAGFTLIELLVVVAIIGALSSVVISGQGNFNKSLLLTNVAYDLALTLRSVQTYGLGSRVVGATSGSQNAGHGMQFLASSPTTFAQFVDLYPAVPTSSNPETRPGNKLYDSPTELVMTHTLQNSVTVKNFCAQSSGIWACAYPSGSVGTGTLTALDIVFSRPNSDPAIRINSNEALSATEACITLTSPQGGDSFISVTPAGQIHTKATTCP